MSLEYRDDPQYIQAKSANLKEMQQTQEHHYGQKIANKLCKGITKETSTAKKAP